MKMKFLAPVLAFAMVAGCSDNQHQTEAVDEVTNISKERDLKENLPNAAQPRTASPEVVFRVRPYDDVTDGECYVTMTARSVFYKDTTTPNGFDKAKEYFEYRVAKNFDLDGVDKDLISGLYHKFMDYNKSMADKYGLPNLNEREETIEPVCIANASDEIAKISRSP